MPSTIRAYITTFRPSKADRVPPEILKAIRRKFSYGVSVFSGAKEIGFASSWVYSKEAQYPEMLGVSGLLDALEDRDELPFLQLILHSAHLDTVFTQVANRLRKKQQGNSVSVIKNESRWEETTLRLQRFDRGLREAIGDELAEIVRIKESLRADFYSCDRFAPAAAPEFALNLSDE